MKVKLEPSWYGLLEEEFQKPYFLNLADFVKAEYQRSIIYPPGKLIFNALDSLPVEGVRVVILGQDPYHGPGQAQGLSFSVPAQVALPPSLQNIYKELFNDLGIKRQAGDLSDWVSQGVLLLNSTLTVRSGQAGSHQGKGWETFTNAIISKLASQKQNLVFILWGRYAQNKCQFLDPKKHFIISSSHPSPLSAYNGFFGSKPFSRTNDYLLSKGQKSINW